MCKRPPIGLFGRMQHEFEVFRPSIGEQSEPSKSWSNSHNPSSQSEAEFNTAQSGNSFSFLASDHYAILFLILIIIGSFLLCLGVTMIICLIKSRSNSGRKFITRGGVNNGSATYHQNPNLIVDVGSNKDASPCSIHLPSAEMSRHSIGSQYTTDKASSVRSGRSTRNSNPTIVSTPSTRVQSKATNSRLGAAASSTVGGGLLENAIVPYDQAFSSPIDDDNDSFEDTRL
ncbi:uncharacterized protein LOC142342211 [Convolutriloba macropyga]|uniref:uncharacterized protein LOC142342211 n=1 Tax=Convolutriloba macropyga TaxID=536237 RepID=UPI003F52438A